MIILNLEEIILLHKKIINKTGGILGIRDIELLKSAIENSFQTFGGEELYPDVISKISALTFSIINNHPMIDGNKRLGVALMGILCELNGIKLNYTQKELVELGLGIAKGEYQKEYITEWIKEHCNKE